MLKLQKRAPGRGDLLSWKWTKGQSTDLQAFGDPYTGTRYALCTYDQSSGVFHSLVIDWEIPPIDNSCINHFCWNHTSSGFKYVSPDRSWKLKLKSGVDGKAAIYANAKKVDITSSPFEYLLLTQDSDVTVQLINDVGAGECWESVFSRPARKNDGVRFSDSAP